jgi:acetyl-CoA carboxylase carboxyl transferase subunit beta
VHTAEFAYEHGLVDAIVPEADQPATIARILSALTPKRTAGSGSGARTLRADSKAAHQTMELSAWDKLQLARAPGRPKAPFVLDKLVGSHFDLRGDRTGATDDERVIVRLGYVHGTSINVVAIGQDASGDGRIRPQGFRKAVRAIELAGRLGVPVVTLIDTRGADPLPSSEGHGVASAIARTFEAMLGCPSPTLAVVIGEGGSGGALAMAPADRVLAWEHAVFSVIAPEGAATILYRDPARAPELAARLKITAPDLVDLGIVDVVVPEPHGGAQSSPQTASEDLAAAVVAELERLVEERPRPRLRKRGERWRKIGARYIKQA